MSRASALSGSVLARNLISRILATIGFVALQAAAYADPHQLTHLIDDFEGPTAVDGWRFYSSNKVGAVEGSLALGPGHRGRGAVLTYRIGCGRTDDCDAYAAAFWRPPSPLPRHRNSAVSLWIRFRPEVEVSFVAKDTGGQTLRFPIEATLECPKAGEWQHVVVPLSPKPAADAANRATGRTEKRLVEIGIVVRARALATVQGSVSFDDIELRESSEIFHVDPAAQGGPSRLESSELAPIGVNIHLLRDNRALDLARGAGFGFVRMDMLWAKVERA